MEKNVFIKLNEKWSRLWNDPNTPDDVLEEILELRPDIDRAQKKENEKKAKKILRQLERIERQIKGNLSLMDHISSMDVIIVLVTALLFVFSAVNTLLFFSIGIIILSLICSIFVKSRYLKFVILTSVVLYLIASFFLGIFYTIYDVYFVILSLNIFGATLMIIILACSLSLMGLGITNAVVKRNFDNIVVLLSVGISMFIAMMNSIFIFSTTFNLIMVLELFLIQFGLLTSIFLMNYTVIFAIARIMRFLLVKIVEYETKL